MDARNWHWFTVCGHSYPSLRAQMTVREILDAASYGVDQFRLVERGRVLDPTLVINVNGRHFDVEVK